MEMVFKTQVLTPSRAKDYEPEWRWGVRNVSRKKTSDFTLTNIKLSYPKQYKVPPYWGPSERPCSHLVRLTSPRNAFMQMSTKENCKARFHGREKNELDQADKQRRPPRPVTAPVQRNLNRTRYEACHQWKFCELRNPLFPTLLSMPNMLGHAKSLDTERNVTLISHIAASSVYEQNNGLAAGTTAQALTVSLPHTRTRAVLLEEPAHSTATHNIKHSVERVVDMSYESWERSQQKLLSGSPIYVSPLAQCDLRRKRATVSPDSQLMHRKHVEKIYHRIQNLCTSKERVRSTSEVLQEVLSRAASAHGVHLDRKRK